MGAEAQLALVEPCIEYSEAFIEMVEEYQIEGSRYSKAELAAMRSDFPAYLLKLQRLARGDNLRPGRVPQAEFWLADLGAHTILGAIRLRSGLTPRLERIDGQIGYNVRPSARQMGYATRMLAMLLEKIRAEGWQRVLITCNADNIASARVIKSNGGRLENQVIEAETGRLISRYWIDLAEC
jgi:predicted acetyltransferase